MIMFPQCQAKRSAVILPMSRVVMLSLSRGCTEDITLTLNVMGVHNSSINSLVYSNMGHHYDFLCQHICSVTAVGHDYFLQFVTL